ncbi:MAG: S8 family serine peptidase [bacterium]
MDLRSRRLDRPGYTGDGIIVAHFDTGVWLTHPDLANRLWVNVGEIPGNSTDDDGNGYEDDVNGWDFGDQDSNPNDDVIGSASNHGTHTAGTVAGDGSNGTHTGVAPGASIMVCKSFNSDGSGAPFSAIYEGQEYAIEMGARIFTMSLGIGCSLGTAREIYMRQEREIADNIRAAGVIFFNSAGNDNYTSPNCDPPVEMGLTARVPAPWNAISGTPYTSLGGVVAVGGTGYKNYSMYSASSRGPVNWDDIAPWNDWPLPTGLLKPDVAAPGTNVNSCQKPSGYTGDTWSGTSMACPHAAGCAALMLSKNPSLSPAGVDSIMEQTANDLGIAGKDNDYGSGLIDAYAAVSAVPVALTPHLVWTGYTQDPAGDLIFDPGETADLFFELTNNSLVTAGISVTANLAVGANPYVSVTDGAGTFGTIALDGGTADNSSDPFTMTCSAGAPNGFEFTVYLTVNAQNGYQKTFDIGMIAGLPEFLTHDVGAVQGTVTCQGSIGYMSTDQTEGVGFGPNGGASHLYIGTLWGGTTLNYMCAKGYDEAQEEWEVSTSPLGRVVNMGAGLSDQDYQAIFTDGGHPSPEDISVTQRSYAWSSAPNDDFIMLHYTFLNNGASDLTNYYTGIFCDWDIGNYATNEGGVDAGRNLAYVYSAGDIYAGVALLYPHTPSNLTMIKNETYVYTNGYIEDSMKDRHLKGIISNPTSDAPNDWSALTAVGPLTLPAGQEVTVVFAMIRGEGLIDLQNNTDAAQAMYYTTPVTELTPVAFNLSQNHPNPFNPVTNIQFAVEAAGQVKLDVFDVSGRKVRTLVNTTYSVGDHVVVWDGRDDAGQQMPSGIYCYRYETGNQVMSRKMMLVK